MAYLNLTDSNHDIYTQGSNVFKVWEVNADGTSIAGSPVVSFGDLAKVKWTVNPNNQQVRNETGRVAKNIVGDRDISFTIQLEKTGKDVLDIPEIVESKYYMAYRLDTPQFPASVSATEIFCFGQIVPKTEKESPNNSGITVELEFVGTYNRQAITIPQGTVTASGTAGFAAYYQQAVTISANKTYKIVSTPISS